MKPLQLIARRSLASGLTRHAAPLIAPVVLLMTIRAFAVNVPYQDEWDIVPFILKLRNGQLTLGDFWAQHNAHRIASVRLIMAPLAWATDFDVTANMYAGFALALLSFVCLLAALETTLRTSHRQLVPLLSGAISLMLFSTAQHEDWLWGLTSLQWHLSNSTAAASIWVLARWPGSWFTMLTVFALTVVGMLALASGLTLWCVCLVAILTQSFVDRRDLQWGRVAGWSAGAVTLAAAYFIGFRRTGQVSHLSSFGIHPLDFCLFVLVELGSPFTQGARPAVAGLVGLGGLTALGVAAYVGRSSSREATESMLPWLWLAAYALLVAAVIGVGRIESGILAAMVNRYTTGAMLFWVSLLVVGAVALQERLRGRLAAHSPWLLLAAGTLAVASGIAYVQWYRHGYREFVGTYYRRTTALAELYGDERARGEALSFLYKPGDGRCLGYVRSLEAFRLGPFAGGMAAERRRLEAGRVLAGKLVAGEGNLQVCTCEKIAGWAWDRAQPNLPVGVDVYDGQERLATVTAYWFRWDLLDGGKGNGRHGFEYVPPASLRDGRPHSIRVRISGAQVDLAGSPKSIVCATRPASGAERGQTSSMPRSRTSDRVACHEFSSGVVTGAAALRRRVTLILAGCQGPPE